MAVRLNREYSKNILTDRHNVLKNRDLPDQHPIKAITGLTEILTETSKKIDGKVDKVPGKDLSDENFTVAYKDILSKMKYEDNHLLFDNNAILCLNEYTSNKRYYVNDTCVYNNKIYKCLANYVSNETFDDSKWQLVVCEDLSIYKTKEEFNYDIQKYSTFNDCYKYAEIKNLESYINGGIIRYPIELIRKDYTDRYKIIFQRTTLNEVSDGPWYWSTNDLNYDDYWVIFSKNEDEYFEKNYYQNGFNISILIELPEAIYLEKLIIKQTNLQKIKILGSNSSASQLSKASIHVSYDSSEVSLYENAIDTSKTDIEIPVHSENKYKSYRIVFTVTSNAIISSDPYGCVSKILIGHISLYERLSGIQVSNIKYDSLNDYVKKTSIVDLTDEDINTIVDNI